MIHVLCTLSDDALCLFKVSLKYLKGSQSYGANTFFVPQIPKGHNTAKFQDGVMALVMPYICSKFHENTFDSFKVIEWT